jgi:DNA-binding winged helix-turn-helix (wHTH) protein
MKQALEGEITMTASGTITPSTESLLESPLHQLEIKKNGQDHQNARLPELPQTERQQRDTFINRAITFGSFRLLPAQRLLLKGSDVVHIGSRAMDILIALVERPSELVSKAELMARVWPTTFVEPANLTVHVSALRRALGDGRDGNRFFINIPGRGYIFVAPVTVNDISEPAHPHPVHKWYASVARDIQAIEPSTAA